MTKKKRKNHIVKRILDLYGSSEVCVAELMANTKAYEIDPNHLMTIEDWFEVYAEVMNQIEGDNIIRFNEEEDWFDDPNKEFTSYDHTWSKAFKMSYK